MRMLLIGLVACGGSKPAPQASGEAEPAMTAQMPDSAEAKSFAKKLVALTITDYEVSGGGATLGYKTLTFAPSGQWNADGVVEASYETFDCKESGSWMIDKAESSDAAVMVWTLESTSCATREKGTEVRLRMVIDKAGEFQVQYR